jgi:CubicO group peptidase (beta-lactamase class C family)
VGDTEHVDAYVAELQQRYHLRGVAVVVIRDGAIVVESGQGVAGPSGEPVTADTPFRIGSTSKQLTGLLIQQLIAEGALTHATTIGEALPWFGGGSARLSTITVEQLLAHFSGLSTRAGLEQWGAGGGIVPNRSRLLCERSTRLI